MSEDLRAALDALAGQYDADDYIWELIEQLIDYCGDEDSLHEITHRFMFCAKERAKELRVPEGVTWQ